MRAKLRRIRTDVAQLRSIDAYVVSAIAICFAALSVIGDILSDDLRWAVIFAGIGLLVYRVTTPDGRYSALEPPLGDRRDLEVLHVENRLDKASTLWLYAPSGINFLSQERCDVLRAGILARAGGEVRVIVMDPAARSAVELTSRQIDDSVDFVVQRLRPSLEASIERLKTMVGWDVPGTVSYRLLDYNPGLSILIIDPRSRDGLVIVELHGCHGESPSTRMHLRLTPSTSRWFSYWVDQFEHLWKESGPPSRGG